MVDLTPFAPAIDAIRQQSNLSCADPRGEFMSILVAEGFTGMRQIVIGKLQRIDSPEDKRGKKSAWYVYAEIDDSQNDGAVIGVANYGDWKTDLSETWSSRAEHRMDGAERARYHAQREAMRIEYENELENLQAETAARAFEIWSSAPQATQHAYLTKKGVSASQGLKIAKDGRLILPMAIDGQITSLQFINDDGEKRFLSGGKIKGAWYVIEGISKTDDTIYIAEGLSTGESIAEATGQTVYVAFNAGNLYEVASYVKNTHSESRIIIAGDDDFKTATNVGRAKAEQAASGLGLECIFPDGGVVDFNDFHKEFGLAALVEYLKPSDLQPYKPKGNKLLPDVPRPSGILGEIFDYYNATSGSEQHGFATQCAFAALCTITGRKYRTSLSNWPNSYFLCVGKSATGKEHIKQTYEKLLHSVGCAYMLAGDGYTSAGAVFSTLLDKPNHGCSIDELGRYLEAGKAGKGNLHQREANTKLMEAVTRTSGTMRPQNYSTMTLKKDAANEIKGRYIHNPSITLLTMTTPSTLFSTLDMDAVKDGFINRFIIFISEAQRQARNHKEPLPVPESIINWTKKILARSGRTCIATEEAKPIVLDFTQDAKDKFKKFENECIEIQNKLELHGMAELAGRTNEQAMKLSLVHALSRDPMAEYINDEDARYCVEYMRARLKQTIDKLKLTISHSQYEADKKEILAALRALGSTGITRGNMYKTPPFSKFKKRDMDDILNDLKAAGLAADETVQPNGAGRPSVLWIALD